MKTLIKAGDTIPRGCTGRIVLMRRNSIGGRSTKPEEIEWFAASEIKADAWECPETVEGCYYVHDD